MCLTHMKLNRSDSACRVNCVVAYRCTCTIHCSSTCMADYNAGRCSIACTLDRSRTACCYCVLGCKLWCVIDSMCCRPARIFAQAFATLATAVPAHAVSCGNGATHLLGDRNVGKVLRAPLAQLVASADRREQGLPRLQVERICAAAVAFLHDRACDLVPCHMCPLVQQPRIHQRFRVHQQLPSSDMASVASHEPALRS